MTQQNTDPLNTICDLKWNYPIFNLDRGEFRSCCRTPSRRVAEHDLLDLGPDAFLNSPTMIQSRLDLINGVKHSDCHSCWNLEEKNMLSPRHKPIQFWDRLKIGKFIDPSLTYSDENLRAELKKINNLDHPALKSRHPYMLEISLGNTCDMKCMYCSHHYSTQWAAEKIKYKEITQQQYDREFPKAPDMFLENFWKWFDTVKTGIGRIGIIGGEPLIMPEFYNLIDQLIDSIKEVEDQRKKKPTFWIVSNMNTPANYLEKFLVYLPKLTEVFNVEILVSMESVGQRAEYIRNGLNWNKFNTNLNTLLSKEDLKFEFGFILSINSLCISNLKEFIQYTEDLYKKYGRPVALKHNIITFPNWQSPFILTADFADYIDDCVAYMKTRTDEMPVVNDFFGRWDQYIIFLENLSSSLKSQQEDVYKQRKKFAEWFETYDHRRKLDLVQTFPEYRNFLNLCKNL